MILLVCLAGVPDINIVRVTVVVIVLALVIDIGLAIPLDIGGALHIALACRENAEREPAKPELHLIKPM